jgi:hypothetical protein
VVDGEVIEGEAPNDADDTVVAAQGAVTEELSRGAREEGAGEGGEVGDVMACLVEMLEQQVWHRKLLVFERRPDGRYAACVGPCGQQATAGSRWQPELDLPLEGLAAEPAAAADCEFSLRSGGREWRFCADSAQDRKALLAAADDMRRRAAADAARLFGDEGGLDLEVGLAGPEEAGGPCVLAQRAHMVAADEEVWI